MKLPADFTIESILNCVSQEQIFEYYLQEPVDFNRSYLSPFRKDRNPTCTIFATRRGKLWFKDWNGNFAGDCFDFVCAYYSCTLPEAMKHIDRDLRLNLFNNSGLPPSINKVQRLDYTPKESAIIQVKFREWSAKDLAYWQRHGIYPEQLNLYQTAVATHLWVGVTRVWDYRPDNPIFVYLVNGQIKGYRPLEQDKKRKWISNCTPDNVLGWNQLPATGSLCIITKSMKDVMRLHRMGYAACAVQAEENHFPEEKMKELLQRFEEVIMFYDNDEAGRRRSLEEALKYKLRAIFIPETCLGKDISGFTKYYGEEQSVDLLEALIMDDIVTYLKMLSMKYENDRDFAKVVRLTLEQESERAKLVETILAKKPDKVDGYAWIVSVETQLRWYKAFLMTQSVQTLQDIINKLNNETTESSD